MRCDTSKPTAALVIKYSVVEIEIHTIETGNLTHSKESYPIGVGN